jgi:two-component system chemotaxis response regulator CheY
LPKLRAALEALRATGPVDLVLVDSNMPEMGGLELLLALRADREFEGVRVMMVTAEADFGAISQALEAGADELLAKPFTRKR